MKILLWILVSGVLMSAIALVGLFTFLFKEDTFKRLILPLVAVSAGSLIGGAFFHMLPSALNGARMATAAVFLWAAAGFTMFFALEQFVHHHHCHRVTSDCRKPASFLLLIGDGIHNFLGGLAVGGAFVLDVRVGVATWLAAAAHEVPQELGDFGALVHSGWTKKQALKANFLSASPFIIGGVTAYFISFKLPTDFLIAFAAGNFIYIGASDLVPEVNKARTGTQNIIHFLAFSGGVGLMEAIRVFFEH